MKSEGLMNIWYQRGYARGRNGAPYRPPTHTGLLKEFHRGLEIGTNEYEATRKEQAPPE